MSVIIISVKLIIPPAPIPCKLLPTNIIAKFLAKPATIAPTAKKVIATKITGLRPKICEKLANEGWKTVDVRRNEVPDQKASIAVPLSLDAMIGSATEREVASNAAARVTTESVVKARMKR